MLLFPALAEVASSHIPLQFSLAFTDQNSAAHPQSITSNPNKTSLLPLSYQEGGTTKSLGHSITFSVSPQRLGEQLVIYSSSPYSSSGESHPRTLKIKRLDATRRVLPTFDPPPE